MARNILDDVLMLALLGVGGVTLYKLALDGKLGQDAHKSAYDLCTRYGGTYCGMPPPGTPGPEPIAPPVREYSARMTQLMGTWPNFKSIMDTWQLNRWREGRWPCDWGAFRSYMQLISSYGDAQGWDPGEPAPDEFMMFCQYHPY